MSLCGDFNIIPFQPCCDDMVNKAFTHVYFNAESSEVFNEFGEKIGYGKFNKDKTVLEIEHCKQQ